jgi:hypothetical protein
VDELRVRAAAAIDLLHRSPGAVDPALLLSFVVWPTPALEQLPEQPVACWHRRMGGDELGRIRELAAQGLSNYEIGRRLGRPRSTVSAALARTRADAPEIELAPAAP